MNVWVVEDDSGYRRSLQRMLNREKSIHCGRVFGTCAALFEALDSEAMPDMVLMDLGLPEMDGVEGILYLTKQAPDLAVVVLTVFSAKEKVLDALDAGAAGYLLKSASSQEIVRGLEEVFQGGAALSPEIAKTVISEMRKPGPGEDFGLSEREWEVLRYLANGLLVKEIAATMNVSTFTVKFHTKNLYRKLHVHSQSGAVAKAFRSGLLE